MDVADLSLLSGGLFKPMLHLVRKFGVEKRWVAGTIMGAVALVFILSMGWMGMTAPTGIYAAKVNGDEILMVEFNRAYKGRYKQMEKLFGDQFNDELIQSMGLKQQVVMDLIDHRLWTALAEEMKLYVTDRELKDDITSTQAFQVNNRFNSAHYKRTLARAGMSPEKYEMAVRGEMMAAKVRDIVRAAAQVTDADLVEYPEDDADLSEAERAKLRQQRLEAAKSRKQAQLLASYISQLRAKADIEIFWDTLGVDPA